MALVKVVEHVFLPVEITRDDDEEAPCDEGEDGHRAVVPYQVWISGEGWPKKENKKIRKASRMSEHMTCLIIRQEWIRGRGVEGWAYRQMPG